jgi:hypothetical protein
LDALILRLVFNCREQANALSEKPLVRVSMIFEFLDRWVSKHTLPQYKSLMIIKLAQAVRVSGPKALPIPAQPKGLGSERARIRGL